MLIGTYTAIPYASPAPHITGVTPDNMGAVMNKIGSYTDYTTGITHYSDGNSKLSSLSIHQIHVS